MKKLIIMRHAESHPDHSGLNDRERPLSGDGLEELELVRKSLQKETQGLSLVLCSGVKRTRQTLEGIKAVLPSSCDYMFEDGLYHASAPSLVTRFKDVEDIYDFVMVIAHNPGVSDFLNLVIHSTQPPSRLPKMFPPAGVAIFEGNFKKWKDANPALFTLQSFLMPGR